MNRIEVVVDTNVFIDAVFGKIKVCDIILRKEIRGEISFAMSVPIVDEISNTFIRVADKFNIERSELDKYMTKVLDRIYIRSRHVVLTKKTKNKTFSEDNEDDKFIHCAIDGRIDYIITSDGKHLLPLDKKIVNCDGKLIRIVKPEEFNRHIDELTTQKQLQIMMFNYNNKRLK